MVELVTAGQQQEETSRQAFCGLVGQALGACLPLQQALGGSK